MSFEQPKLTPGESEYIGPGGPSVVRPVVHVLQIGEAVVRATVSVTQDGIFATLEHDYPDLDAVGETFRAGDNDYTVTARDGRTLTIEAA